MERDIVPSYQNAIFKQHITTTHGLPSPQLQCADEEAVYLWTLCSDPKDITQPAHHTRLNKVTLRSHPRRSLILLVKSTRPGNWAHTNRTTEQSRDCIDKQINVMINENINPQKNVKP